MSQNMSNGKSYTDVVLEFSDRLDTVEQRIIKRLDVIAQDNADIKAGLARDDARFHALDKSCVSIAKRIDTNAADIKKVGGLNAFATIVASTIAGIIGTQK